MSIVTTLQNAFSLQVAGLQLACDALLKEIPPHGIFDETMRRYPNVPQAVPYRPGQVLIDMFALWVSSRFESSPIYAIQKHLLGFSTILLFLTAACKSQVAYSYSILACSVKELYKGIVHSYQTFCHGCSCNEEHLAMQLTPASSHVQKQLPLAHHPMQA